MAKDIVGYEEGFSKLMTSADYSGLMPNKKFWEEDETKIQKEMAKDIREVGEGAQTGLLNLYQKQQQSQARRGFAATGNPMIDNQRKNIFQDIQRKTTAAWGTGQEDIADVWGEYQEAWEVGLEDYMAG